MKATSPREYSTMWTDVIAREIIRNAGKIAELTPERIEKAMNRREMKQIAAHLDTAIRIMEKTYIF